MALSLVSGQIAYVTGFGVTRNTTAGTSLPSGVTSGNSVLIITMQGNGTGWVTEPTDNQSNVYTQLGTASAAGNLCVQFWLCENITNAPTDFSGEASNSPFRFIRAYEISGSIDTGNSIVSAVPTEAAGYVTSTFTCTTNPSLADANGLYFAGMGITGGAAKTMSSVTPSGVVQWEAGSVDYNVWHHENPSSGSYVLTGTQSSAGTAYFGQVWLAASAVASTPGIEIFRTIPGVTH